jgi:photosystem II stability/assembly factor-like uncharacterized protein
MNKLTFLLFSALLLNFNINSAWYPQTSGTTQTLNSVYFTSSNIGYVVGNNGIILKTTDKGARWNIQVSGTTSNLYSVRFLDAQNGFAVGDNVFLKTTNGGVSWILNTTSLSYSAKTVFFINQNTGYAAGGNGTISKTINGGSVWVAFLVEPYTMFTSLYFTNPSTGFAVGLTGMYLKTTNGGNSWFSKYADASKNYYSVQFVNENTGYITGGWVNSTVMKSENAGNTWTNLFSNAFGVRLYSGSFIDAEKGYVCGRYGTILRTSDGGSTWLNETSGTTAFLYGIHYLNEQAAYAVGDGGTILSTVSVIGISQISSYIPSEFTLSQNYPNPFNPITKISFSIPLLRGVSEVDGLPAAGRGVLTKLTVFDILGRESAILVNQELSPGTYEVDFDAGNLSSGTYFYRLQSGDYVETKKMTVVK